MPAKDIDWSVYLKYDPSTGNLIWKERDLSLFSREIDARRWNSRWAGKVAGNKNPVHIEGYKGAIVVSLRKRFTQASYIVWVMHGNPWPEKGMEIDHKDGDRWNNRIENLRLATRSQNETNKGASRRNKSGSKGVYFCQREKKYIVEIIHSGKRRYIGSFIDKEAAVAARIKAAKELHGEFFRA